MQRAHLLPVAAGFLCGIVAELHGFALVALGCGLAFAFAASLPRPGVRTAIAVALALGVLLARFHGEVSFSPEDVRSRTYSATFVEQIGPFDAAEFVLHLDDGRHVTVALPHVSLPIGTRVTLRAQFEPPDEPRNPGEPSPREFASERGLAGRLVHPHLISASPVDTHDVSLWLPRLRVWAGTQLRSRLDEPYATILAGMLWGERGALPPDLRAEFQDTGTVHVLVTAGLHLGVVAMLALALIGALGGGRITSSLATIGVVWLYAIFSGAHLPSVRAATMVSFALLARASGRSALSWNAFAAAAIVLAALRPVSVQSLSFALSFSCVGAILLLAEPLTKGLERLGVPALGREAIALTLATQAGTWPLTASAFLVFAPYAPLANALVVPVVGVAMLVGFAELAANSIPPLAQACANVELSLLTWIVSVVRLTANLPDAHVIATPPPPWTIALYDVALAGAALLAARRRRLWAAAILAGAVALCLWPPRAVSHELIVTAVDVGQADALLIQTPRGHAILVDAGGRLERGPFLASGSPAEAIGERIVVPFLIRRGIHHLDAIILSHPHGDHAGGVAPALRLLGANTLADGGQHYGGFAYRDAMSVARAKNTTVVYPRAGVVWRTNDDVTIAFLSPRLPFITGSRNDINNNSLVFRLQYKSFRMLFTGDAGAEAEERILSEGADLQADVLKVGHHGSAYGSSPEFIKAVHPKYALISVGRHNLFGHPAPQTLRTLQRFGVRAYRTDQDCAIALTSDGHSMTVGPTCLVRSYPIGERARSVQK